MLLNVELGRAVQSAQGNGSQWAADTAVSLLPDVMASVTPVRGPKSC